MRSRKTGAIVTIALSFNNRGPFGGFYRYIGEEETYKVFRDTMTSSESKDVQLDALPAYDRQDLEFIDAIRAGREPEASVASCVPTMALLDKIQKSMDISFRSLWIASSFCMTKAFLKSPDPR
jgi:2-hydroxy-4-carboxymuconate semialdehyde hemiacetal dehydrogenase